MNTLNFRLIHGKINMSLITFFHTCHHIGTTWYNYVISRGHFYPILPISRKIGLPVYVNRFACKHCPLLHPNPRFMLAQAEVKHITNTDGLGYTTLRCGFLNSFHLMWMKAINVKAESCTKLWEYPSWHMGSFYKTKSIANALH